jgi:multicomponent Na+:H+ antiporter subunit D
MIDPHASPVLVILTPLAAALAGYVLRGRFAALLGAATVLTIDAAAVHMTWLVVRNGPQRYPLGSWIAPLGIDLYADGLSCLMLLMAAVVMTAVSIYAARYFHNLTAAPQGQTAERPAPTNMFWPLWFFLWSALNALFLSADIFNLYVTLELLTLAAIALVALAGTRTAIDAALRYLLAALGGSLFYLVGVAFLYGEYGALDIATLATRTEPTIITATALLLMLAGLMLKSALFPLHYWLPPAHGSAPAPVSAVLSGLVVKASFYLLLRLWFEVFPSATTSDPAALVAFFAAGAILWGSTQAIFAERLKTLIAYSTIAQLGYVFMLFGLARPDTASGFRPWSAGLLMAASHACAKAAFFMAAGTILHFAGHDQIKRLATVSHRLPMTFFAIGVAAISLLGLPPSASFVAKWALIETAIADGQWWIAIVVLGGSLLAAIYLFRVVSAAFESAPDNQEPIDLHDAPRWLERTTLTLAVIGFLLGLFTAPILQLIEIGAPWLTAQEAAP